MINVMVSLNGVNEEGNVITALHTFKVHTEKEVADWIALAPAIQRNIDDGPEIRVEIPGKARRKD